MKVVQSDTVTILDNNSQMFWELFEIIFYGGGGRDWGRLLILLEISLLFCLK